MKKMVIFCVFFLLFSLSVSASDTLADFEYHFSHNEKELTFSISLESDGTLVKEYEDGDFFDENYFIHYFGNRDFDKNFLDQVYSNGYVIQKVPALYYCKNALSSFYDIYSYQAACTSDASGVFYSTPITGTIEVLDDSKIASNENNSTATGPASDPSLSNPNTSGKPGNSGSGINKSDLCEGDDCNISLHGLCDEPRVARTLKFIGLVIFIIKIFIPLLIIILGCVDFAKAMMDGKSDAIPKKFPILMKRFIAGVIVFMIPTILNILFGVIDTYSETMQKYSNCRVCVFEPDDCEIKS